MTASRQKLAEEVVAALTDIVYTDGNYQEAKAHIGAGYAPCTLCDGWGEYETEYGPKGCDACCSRLFPVQTANGVRYADYGDTIRQHDDGTCEVIYAPGSGAASL